MSPDVKTLSKFRTDPLAFIDALIIPSGRGVKRFGECMAEFQRERFQQIIPALLAVAKDERPPIGRYWWEATKGASKDSDLAVCLLWLIAFTRRPLSCQIGAADQDQADEMRQIMKGVLRLNDWLAKRIQIQSWKIVCPDTASHCTVLAADVAGSHGARPDVLILNELSCIQNSKQEFAENLMDNAAKVPNGLAIIATNSGFTGTWQERWRKTAEDSDRWSMNVFDRPSPWLDEAEIDEAKRRNSRARYLRLWQGVWASSAGDALDPADIQAAINPQLRQSHSGQPGWFYVGGLDLGVKQDHSALVIVGANRSTLQLRLAYAQNWAPDETTGKVDLMAIERACLDLHQRFNMIQILYDPFQCALLSQRLEVQSVPMKELTFTGKNLNLMASTCLDVFRSRRIEMYDCPRLVADLSRLTIEEKSYGYRLSATRDENGHADLATALVVALTLAVEEVGVSPVTVGAVDLNKPWQGNESPYQRHLKEAQKEAKRNQDEMRALSKPENVNEGFAEALASHLYGASFFSGE